jgi:mRNA interferase RelE/StbE
MPYRLRFENKARKAWEKLDSTIRDQFKKVLDRRLEQPRLPSARLRGGADIYKIKLRDAGYRLIYEVNDAEIVVFVIAVGRRKEVYSTLERMFGDRYFD